MPLGDGVELGQMGVTLESDTVIPCESCGEEIPEQYQACIEEENDRFTFKATFEGGQLVMMYLEKEGEEHAYFISTAKHRFAAMCCGTFVEKDERKVSCSVNKAGLSGTYDVKVFIDDKKYETGLKITC